MGGFSASYLIRCENAAEVEKQLRRSLTDEGWAVTDEQLDDEEMWGVGGQRRGIIICQARSGWVPVIDSAAMVSDSPRVLSGEMQTSAFNFHVHDSDFWMYALYRSGTEIDQFASVDQGEYFGKGEVDLGTPTSLNDRWDAMFDLLAEGISRADFDQTLSPIDLNNLDPTSFIFAEQGLENFLALIGAPTELAHMNYRAWIVDSPPVSLEELCHFVVKQS